MFFNNRVNAEAEIISNNALLEFLVKLDVLSIPYVSWKNNHELKLAISGQSDLDIFVPHEFCSEFTKAFKEDGWLLVFNPVASYPWVIHLYKVDESLNTYHLHVYYKVVTGESWLKEYVLPLTEFIILQRVKSTKFDIWVLNETAQAYIFMLRHLLKCGSFFSRFIYFKEMQSYKNEWIHCNNGVNKLDFDRLGVSYYKPVSGLSNSSFSLPRLGVAMRFRATCMPFLRYPWWSLIFLRLFSFSTRIINKALLRKKKLIPNGGVLFAITGVDGAGKSTMLNEAEKFYGNFLSVKVFHLGRPQGRVTELIRKTIFNEEKTNEKQRKRTHKNITSNMNLKKALLSCVLAHMRLKTVKRAYKYVNKGYVVLVDRWPTLETGKMDGPRIQKNSANSFLMRICQKYEEWMYSHIPDADVCYLFKLPIEDAIQRNRSREKIGKETDQEIAKRYESNRNYVPLATNVMEFNNSGEFSTKRTELLSLIWHDLLKRQG